MPYPCEVVASSRRLWVGTHSGRSLGSFENEPPEGLKTRASSPRLTVFPRLNQTMNPLSSKSALLFVRLTLFGIVLASAHADLLRDGSFEGPPPGGNRPAPKSSMTYHPTGVPWQFNRGSGMQLAAERDVHFFVPGNQAPDGLWIAFLQGEKARISQQVLIPSGGRHRLAYFAAGRDQDPPFGGDTQYEIRANGRRIAFEATYSHQPWTRRVADFTAIPGTNLLEFILVSPLQSAGAHLSGAAFMLDAVTLEPLNTSNNTRSNNNPDLQGGIHPSSESNGGIPEEKPSVAATGSSANPPATVADRTRFTGGPAPSPTKKSAGRIPWVWIFLVLALGLLVILAPRLAAALKRPTD